MPVRQVLRADMPVSQALQVLRASDIKELQAEQQMLRADMPELQELRV